MKLVILWSLALCASTSLSQVKAKQEWTLNLAQYGLVKTSCVRYPGHVEFLDDDHLAVAAPVSTDCKSYSGTPLETRITIVDLQGNKLAEVRRGDVAELRAGPIGFVALCAGDRVELLSSNLQAAQSISVSRKTAFRGCYFGPGLTPSRTAIAIAGPGKSQLALYGGSSEAPIATITTEKGQSVRAVTDNGFLVCVNGDKQCNVVGSNEPARDFSVPQLGGTNGFYVVGLVARDQLLLASFDGKRLYAETLSGKNIVMGDVATLKPPFIDGNHAQMSAIEPRRILYQVDGCLLGDFDDCYGVVFHRFAVYDSQTSKMLFKHTYPAGADLKISPNGKLIMEQDGPRIHLFRLP
jgi:hypothetical protein